MLRVAEYLGNGSAVTGKARVEDKDPRLDALAELAKGCAREGHIVHILFPNELSEDIWCTTCPSDTNLMPMRVACRNELIVTLFCERCQARVARPTMRHQMIHEVRDALSVPCRFEEAYLFNNGLRVRMVTGIGLHQEALS